VKRGYLEKKVLKAPRGFPSTKAQTVPMDLYLCELYKRKKVNVLTILGDKVHFGFPAIGNPIKVFRGEFNYDTAHRAQQSLSLFYMRERAKKSEVGWSL